MGFLCVWRVNYKGQEVSTKAALIPWPALMAQRDGLFVVSGSQSASFLRESDWGRELSAVGRAAEMGHQEGSVAWVGCGAGAAG
jgi:hypothetical protein